MELSTSDIIQIAGIIAAFFSSIIAIIISVAALKQNSKMIEDASRPYITVYANSTQFSSPVFYLVLRNYGNASAMITEFKCDVDLSKYTYNLNAIPFDKIVGTTLNPNQKIVYPLYLLNRERLNTVSISISYKSSTKTYQEELALNIEAYYNSIDIRSFDEKMPLKSVSYAIQNIAEKML